MSPWIRTALRRAAPAAVAAACLAGAARAEILEEIVAKVNNSIITRTQFETRVALHRQQLGRKYIGEELDRKVEEARSAVLRNMILEDLLVQRADVLLDMEKVRKNLLEDFKKQQKIESDEELDRLLREQKMTRKDLLETLVRLSIPQEIINYEVRRRISVSDREIQEFYDSHRAEFVRAERISLREIVIPFEDAAREEARARAEAARRELDAGADFEDVVARESEASSKERGGLVGPFARGELLAGIEAAVWPLQPGEIGGPVDTGRSFHIVRLEAREPEQVTPVGEAREGITERIRDAKFQEKVDEYLEKLWTDNFIYVYPKFGSGEWKAPETPGGMLGTP
jgi:parvulin-like peptidyl-prolyl isomerase